MIPLKKQIIVAYVDLNGILHSLYDAILLYAIFIWTSVFCLTLEIFRSAQIHYKKIPMETEKRELAYSFVFTGDLMRREFAFYYH